MKELVKPTFYTRDYDPAQCVRIFDRYQQYLFIKNNAYPIDMYVSSDENLVMVFDKKETRELYKLYREYKLK